MTGTNKLDNGEKAPPFSSILQENDFAFTNWQKDAANSTEIFYNGSSAKADPLSFSYMPFQIAPFPGKHMHGTCQPNAHNTRETCSNLMFDLNELHNLQTPQMDLNSINIGNNIPCTYGHDLQYPDWNVKGVSCTRDKTGTADNVVNDTVHFNSFQNPAINRKFPLIKGNIHGAYEMTRQGGEVDMSNIYGPQILNVVGSGGSRTYKTQNCNGPQIRSFVGLGGSRTCNTQNTEEIGNENNDEVCTARFGCPEKIDGSFLSLGIGSNTKAKSKADHISREITGSELYGAVSPMFNTSCVQQATGRSLNLGHDFIGGLSSFQNNGFTSLGNHMGRTSSYNNMGVVSGTSASLNSSQFHTLQRPQADIQRRFPTSGTGNQGNVGARDVSYPNLDAYKSFMGKQATSAAPCVNSSTGLLDSGQTGASEFASESVKLVWTARPTSDQLQKHLTETVQNFLPESSMNSSFIRCKGSSTRQEHSVQLFSASKDSAAQAVDGSARPPTRKRVQPAGQLFSANDLTAPYGSVGGLFPKRIGVQVNKDGAAQAAGGATFPQRLGEHVNERRAVQAAGAGLFHRSTGIQATNCHVSYAAECGQHTKEIGVQTATKGQPQLFGADHRGPSFPTGQEISTSKGFGLSQASKVLGVPPPPPSLKRSAIRPPPATPRVQRRKIMLPPPIHPSMLSAYAAPAALVPYPATLHHIRWKGFDGLPQPLGQKCMLCKRDLSFTPEGPIHQLTVPPAVAVLSCGHTFHDNCLQNITPEDQSKDPPCIPCAIGEI